MKQQLKRVLSSMRIWYSIHLDMDSATQPLTKQIENFKDNGDTVTFDVTVENTGSVAGKDVVEIYYTAPYTNGGIEKAAANLIAFEKTDSIEPGESQTKSFTINKEDMASYDSEGI